MPMDDLNDYAYPTMMAETALKELHKAMLEGKYEKALEHGLNARIWTSRIIETVRMKLGND